MTTAPRFVIAFALSAMASAYIPFVITPLIITATGRREVGMAIGVPIGIMVGLLIFPLIAWRPFRAVHLLALPLVVGFLFVSSLLPEDWLTSREVDRNGVYGAIINVVLCALVGYGGLTWVRNILLRTGTGRPP